MKCALHCCSFALLLTGVAGVARAQSPARLTAAQTLGRYISAGLVMLGPEVSQDSLALWWRADGSVSERAARIGAIRDGLVMATDSELVSLAVMMDTLWRNRADTSVERRATTMYYQARRVSRPAPAGARAATAARPVRTAAITSQRVATNQAARGTYRLDVPQHGLTTGQSIRVTGHGALPTLEGRRLWVQVVDATILWLWADSTRSVPVRVRTLGRGGVIEVLR